jgi:NHS family xanthosine MFS transporter
MFTPGYLTAPTLDTLQRVLPGSYLEPGFAGMGISTKQVSFYMSLAQVSEIVLMLSLPFLLKNLGYKWTIYLGIVAWFLRFLIYVFFASLFGTVASIMLHGFCIACFMIGGSLYVAEVASIDIRASSQALYSMVTFGIGRVIGAIFGGYIETANTVKLPVTISIPGMSEMDKLVNWQAIFAVPTGITFACVLAFPFLFRVKKGNQTPEL